MDRPFEFRRRGLILTQRTTVPAGGTAPHVAVSAVAKTLRKQQAWVEMDSAGSRCFFRAKSAWQGSWFVYIRRGEVAATEDHGELRVAVQVAVTPLVVWTVLGGLSAVVLSSAAALVLVGGLVLIHGLRVVWHMGELLRVAERSVNAGRPALTPGERDSPVTHG
jgi:hypothetical protein